jgi:hypothetical protein
MTTKAIDYFNSHSLLRGLASRVALRATGRSAPWSIRQYRLLGLSSNLLLWIPGETAR